MSGGPWNKLDSGLSSRYARHLRAPRRAKDGLESLAAADAVPVEQIRVMLQYEGNLAEIEALGFHTVANPDPGYATGVIAFSDLEAVAAHPGVLKLEFGRSPRPALDVSVPDVRADQVWTRTGETFDDHAGQGVVIGVIDTGVDYRHDYFRGAGDTKRVIAIWDQGLVPEAGEHSPDAALLSGDAGAGVTYGVEYEGDAIQNETARHRDCSGHGTHVASIAAGDGRPEYRFVGVAPRAEIIGVKLLYPETEPSSGGTEIPWPARLHDAIAYVLNKASPRPVVVNCSFGDSLGPHDGFSDDEDWVTHKFEGATGKALVGAAGNDAWSDPNAEHLRVHAQMEFPAGGEAELFVELYDERTNRIEHDRCREEDFTDEIRMKFYYPHTAASVTVGLALPTDPTTYISQAHGTSTAAPVEYGNHQKYEIKHKDDPQVLRGGRGTIRRKLIEITIHPNDRKEHRAGRYRVKIESPDAMTMHVWVDQPRWNYGFRLEASPLTYPPWLTIEDRHLIGDQGGANMITVAAYNAEDADTVTIFSSRGPLVEWGPLPGGVTQPDKPDLSAPGEEIDAALSRDMKPKITQVKKLRTVRLQGTSMSAPHVSGAVALMLQKNSTLTITEIIEKLRTDGVRALAGGEDTEEYGQGRLDVKGAVDSA